MNRVKQVLGDPEIAEIINKSPVALWFVAVMGGIVEAVIIGGFGVAFMQAAPGDGEEATGRMILIAFAVFLCILAFLVIIWTLANPLKNRCVEKFDNFNVARNEQITMEMVIKKECKMRRGLVAIDMLTGAYKLFFCMGLGAFFVFGGVSLARQEGSDGFFWVFCLMGVGVILAGFIPYIIGIVKINAINKAFKKELETGINEMFPYNKLVQTTVEDNVPGQEANPEKAQDDNWIVG